jgi:hypothetical protein
MVREAIANKGLSPDGQASTGLSGTDVLYGWEAAASAQSDETNGNDGSRDKASATVLTICGTPGNFTLQLAFGPEFCEKVVSYTED